jgi:hypothetical protein
MATATATIDCQIVRHNPSWGEIEKSLRISSTTGKDYRRLLDMTGEQPNPRNLVRFYLLRLYRQSGGRGRNPANSMENWKQLDARKVDERSLVISPRLRAELERVSIGSLYKDEIINLLKEATYYDNDN